MTKKVSQLTSYTAPTLDDNLPILKMATPTLLRVTLQKIADLFFANIPDSIITPSKWSNPYIFSVYRNGNVSVSGTQTDTVVFNTKNYDLNNNFNTSTGEYTCPVDGYYWFSAHVRTDMGTANFTQLYVAGDKVNDTPAPVAGQNNLSGGIQRYCAAGTKIVCGIYHNGTATIVGDTAFGAVFSGFLITR